MASYYDNARARAKRVKHPSNLLLFPFAVSGTAAFTWLFLQVVLWIVTIFGRGHANLRDYASDDVRGFIWLPLAMGAFPLGLMFSNCIFWILPPLRRIQDRESVGYPGTDFKNAMKDLIWAACFFVPTGCVVSLIVAFFGK
jgi:hypothetical protein